MDELDIKSSTIEKGLDLLSGFLEKAIGPSINELGMMWADSLRVRRFTNALKCLEKAKKIAEVSNVNIKQIDLKALNPLLEGMSLEEDDTLQDMWANLFVNYIDSGKNLIIHVFPEILKQLSSNEIKLIKHFSKFRNQFIKAEALIETDDGRNLINLNGMSASQEEIDNLVRLGLFETTQTTSASYQDFISDRSMAYKNDFYTSKELGFALIRACER